MQKLPKIGLALGSGSAYGFAYLGLLDELERVGIPIYCITGCSIGAIVGGLYAAGANIEQMQEFSEKLKFSQIIDLGLGGQGFVKGNSAVKQISRAIELFGASETFEGCKTKFGCVATDLLTAKSVALTEGNLVDAMRASFSIPGIFRPHEKDGRLFIDGGPICRVPVRLAREMGADYVIGVDCVGKCQPVTRDELDSYGKVVSRCLFIMDYNASIVEMNEADLLVSMNQKGVDPISLKDMNRSIEYGHEYGKMLVEHLKKRYKF